MREQENLPGSVDLGYFRKRITNSSITSLYGTNKHMFFFLHLAFLAQFLQLALIPLKFLQFLLILP
jgi:hypothetical protein